MRLFEIGHVYPPGDGELPDEYEALCVVLAGDNGAGKSTIIKMISGHLSIRYGIKGPNYAVVTACSTGAHAIGDGARLIKYGDADVMISGGTHTMIHELGLTGFIRLTALSTRNDDPEAASRPFDADRFEVTNHKWTALMELNRGFAVLNDCKYGHDVKGNVLRLSLLRSPTWPDPVADRAFAPTW